MGGFWLESRSLMVVGRGERYDVSSMEGARPRIGAEGVGEGGLRLAGGEYDEPVT